MITALGLEPLTPEEEARHARGIEKIRRKLFCKHSSADFFIVQGSERIFAASAEASWNAACGSYRVFRFGGLSYDFDCGSAAGLCRFSVRHFDADNFIFWISVPQGHTQSCISIAFRHLDEVPYAYVQSCRRANLAPQYAGRANK
jgi:hypothetical protein